MKKGQIHITFNWVYILIAGAVILLFFAGIVAKQKVTSEERLSGDVVRVMDSIFTAAGVSEKTKNFVDISGLSSYTLYFTCEEGISEYGIVGQPARAASAVQPIFAPTQLRSPLLITWSLPYNLPYKASDFLFISSATTKYVLIGSDSAFIREFTNATDGFNVESVESLQDVIPGENFHIRVVDTSGLLVGHDKIIDSEVLQELGDEEVSAVSFTVAGVDFYRKEGSKWKLMKRPDGQRLPIPLISIDDEKNAAKYAAIFAGSAESYVCNMEKALQRLEKVTRIYAGDMDQTGEPGGKFGEIVSYYDSNPQLSLSSDCRGPLETNTENMNKWLEIHQFQISACLISFPDSCSSLIQSASQIRELNSQLRTNCVQLY